MKTSTEELEKELETLKAIALNAAKPKLHNTIYAEEQELPQATQGQTYPDDYCNLTLYPITNAEREGYKEEAKSNGDEFTLEDYVTLKRVLAKLSVSK